MLVPLGVLESPMCEIKMSKLSKKYISETGLLNKYFVEIYLKMTLVSDFQDYLCSHLVNENTWAIEMRKHSTEAATERCSSNLYLTAIIKII